MPSSEVEEFLAGLDKPIRRRDARTLVDLMARVTGEQPQLYGSIVGFGQYHYKYESGQEGDGPGASFAPRKAATVVYLPDGVGAHDELLERLGSHKTGVGSLYIKDLEDVDLAVLETIIANSSRSLTEDVYTKRAREGGK
ncbi:MAG: DUF1801 domain-containing protein [Acidimicrobiia bacterium]|nr:DUF1801 domain-containing protein [Acidimicrobiia bacterium]